jgi:hypothetical protein
MRLFRNILQSICPFRKDRLKVKSTINKKELQFLSAQLLFPSVEHLHLGDKEADLIRHIKEKTEKLNVNNVTRTKAYLEFYENHKEIHWSFLAHMVSRNGGWNMSDLKGSLISPFISEEKTTIFFEFLEKSNALIFQDAYPQLLLYHYSKERRKNLFNLLPQFSVSVFMKPIWDYFWKTKNTPLLTIALIINEQNYIQSRLIENDFYNEEVLDTVLFKAQERMGFTDVLFPFQQRKKIELAGITVQDFKDANQRIETGKKLYGILFNKVLDSAYEFAVQTPHTGSRADFWPDVFTTKREVKHQFYSPTLEKAWPNFTHTFKEAPDWFTSTVVIEQLRDYYIPINYNLTKDYRLDLQRLDVMKDVKKIIT